MGQASLNDVASACFILSQGSHVMDRRTFVVCAFGSLLGLSLAARAQQSIKIPRIGFLRADRPPPGYTEAFEQGLRDRGYLVGKSILIEYRFGDARRPVSRLAEELVKLKVDVLVAGGGQATRAASKATSTIPIVMTSATDPGGLGTVSSLAHPGGNVTGTNTLSWDLFGKRLELLRQILPTVARVAVLHNPRNPAPPGAWEESLAAAATLGVALQRVEVQNPAEFEEAFATMVSKRAEGLIVVQSTMFDTPLTRSHTSLQSIGFRRYTDHE
jgi:putative ABC transport system substrate-binding protein